MTRQEHFGGVEWWMDAVAKKLQEQLANQGKQLQGALAEDLGEVLTALMEKQLAHQAKQLRRVVAEEVGALLAEGGHMRAVRGEVEAALTSLRDQDRKATPRPARGRSKGPGRARSKVPSSPSSSQSGRSDGTGGAGAGGGTPRRPMLRRSDSIKSGKTISSEHMANLVQTAGNDHISSLHIKPSSPKASKRNYYEEMRRAVLRRGEALRAWLRGLEEPPRTGHLACFVDGTVMEAIVCLVICLNFVLMVYTANVEIQNPGVTNGSVLIANWAFQAFYTLEMALKLAVHRQWFFLAEQWKMNISDFTLMVMGFIILNTGSGSEGSVLRMLRFLKFGKSVRALRVMSHLKQLRSFLLCLQACFMNLVWIVVLLFIVYLVFSLFLMQVIVDHLQATGKALEESVFDENFGSVQASVLTLYKASTGGDDWALSYDTIEVAGGLGTGVYLLFIVFVQFALMNIITSIFVESAIVTLSPNSEMLAKKHAQHEQENAKKLEQLCSDVDTDSTGKLTQMQFEEGLNRKHIPMLLSMLGLQRHHVLEFFARMAEAANDDGQVEISKFVKGCMLLKGGATSFDLHQLQAELSQLHYVVQTQEGQNQEVHIKLQNLQDSLSEMSQLLRDSLEQHSEDEEEEEGPLLGSLPPSAPPSARAS